MEEVAEEVSVGGHAAHLRQPRPLLSRRQQHHVLAAPAQRQIGRDEPLSLAWRAVAACRGWRRGQVARGGGVVGEVSSVPVAVHADAGPPLAHDQMLKPRHRRRAPPARPPLRVLDRHVASRPERPAIGGGGSEGAARLPIGGGVMWWVAVEEEEVVVTEAAPVHWRRTRPSRSQRRCSARRATRRSVPTWMGSGREQQRSHEAASLRFASRSGYDEVAAEQLVDVLRHAARQAAGRRAHKRSGAARRDRAPALLPRRRVHQRRREERQRAVGSAGLIGTAVSGQRGRVGSVRERAAGVE